MPLRRYAVFVATLTAVLSELNASGREYRSKLDMLHHYMRSQHMPRALRTKLQAYYELCFPDRQMFQESDILSQLSHSLRAEVALLKCHSVLLTLDVLHDESLARTIANELQRIVFIDQDYIIRRGEPGKGMWFIHSGWVEVLLPDGGSKKSEDEVATTLGKHSFFGEMALLEPGGLATGDVRVKGYAECYHLSREHFMELLAQVIVLLIWAMPSGGRRI